MWSPTSRIETGIPTGAPVSSCFAVTLAPGISAATIGPRGVVMAITHVGGMPSLLEAVDVARSQGATIIALPMKIEGGSGGPLRIIARLPGG